MNNLIKEIKLNQIKLLKCKANYNVFHLNEANKTISKSLTNIESILAKYK